MGEEEKGLKYVEKSLFELELFYCEHIKTAKRKSDSLRRIKGDGKARCFLCNLQSGDAKEVLFFFFSSQFRENRNGKG